MHTADKDSFTAEFDLCVLKCSQMPSLQTKCQLKLEIANIVLVLHSWATDSSCVYADIAIISVPIGLHLEGSKDVCHLTIVNLRQAR